MPTSTLRADLARDGFVVVRQLLTSEELETYRAAAKRTTDRARSGNWPNVRTVGKQFPPWVKPTPGNPPAKGIWGVQGLMNPDLGTDADVFARSYFNEKVLGVAKELLSRDDEECTDDDLVLELYNMLVRPESDFDLEWHRDDIPRTASAELEAERLGIESLKAGQAKRYWSTQWNLALYPDESLIVIPGSHTRLRTDIERNAAPREPTLPNQLSVKLEPGDIAFYDNNILHRGSYDSTKERMSLHGTVGHRRGASQRARNVLQHGLGAWVDRCDFSVLEKDGDGIKARAEGMRERLLKLARESGNVGYSQEG
ncbi:phytanoyl-dioxygenase family protein [Xylariaceae sp. FL0255]|nr:phytanoyl-dioxygenase family protein [Xylariaceae sp. FL0255]